MTSEDKIDVLRDRLQKVEAELMYVRQLRPLLDNGNGWSTAISFELMSEYAIKWMQQEGLFK